MGKRERDIFPFYLSKKYIVVPSLRLGKLLIRNVCPPFITNESNKALFFSLTKIAIEKIEKHLPNLSISKALQQILCLALERISFLNSEIS